MQYTSSVAIPKHLWSLILELRGTELQKVLKVLPVIKFGHLSYLHCTFFNYCDFLNLLIVIYIQFNLCCWQYTAFINHWMATIRSGYMVRLEVFVQIMAIYIPKFGNICLDKLHYTNETSQQTLLLVVMAGFPSSCSKFSGPNTLHCSYVTTAYL